MSLEVSHAVLRVNTDFGDEIVVLCIGRDVSFRPTQYARIKINTSSENSLNRRTSCTQTDTSVTMGRLCQPRPTHWERVRSRALEQGVYPSKP